MDNADDAPIGYNKPTPQQAAQTITTPTRLIITHPDFAKPVVPIAPISRPAGPALYTTPTVPVLQPVTPTPTVSRDTSGQIVSVTPSVPQQQVVAVPSGEGLFTMPAAQTPPVQQSVVTSPTPTVSLTDQIQKFVSGLLKLPAVQPVIQTTATPVNNAVQSIPGATGGGAGIVPVYVPSESTGVAASILPNLSDVSRGVIVAVVAGIIIYLLTKKS